MDRKIQKWLEQYRCMDWAVLYMRLFAGGIMLFHNIGKIQNYNEIIGSYPSLLYLKPDAAFALVTIVEVLLAVLLIVGLRVRLSAFVLALGILLAILWGGFGSGDSDFVWLGIYVFLVISGGGAYSFDETYFAAKRKNVGKE